MELACGNIAKGDAKADFTATFALAPASRKIIVVFAVQHIIFQYGPGSDHADDVSLNKSFSQLGVFQLLANGHLVAFFHQPCNIVIRSMIRDAAHGYTLITAGIAAG